MRLTREDAAALPLAAALRDSDGVMAATPEWGGAGPSAVVYRVGAAQLIVNPSGYDAGLDAMSVRLLEILDRAVDASTNGARHRLTMLVAGLGLVSGHVELRGGSADDVLDHLAAAVEPLSPSVKLVLPTTLPPVGVADAAVVALALKQLVTNAARHDRARSIAVDVAAGPAFTLRWKGAPRSGAGIRSSRHHSARERWGLGFVLLAADALGAVMLAPSPVDDGLVEAVFAVQPEGSRLTLAVAAVDEGGIVRRATRAWDEETGMTPGRRVTGEPLSPLIDQARQLPGRVARVGPFSARYRRGTTWVAMPPAGTIDQARDVIAGLAHEDVLLGAAEPFRSQALAMGALMASSLGSPLPAWSPLAFAASFPEKCRAFGIAAPAVEIGDALRAPEPAVAAYLLAELGGEIARDGDRWQWRGAPPPDHPVSSMVRDGAMRLA